MKDLCKFRSRLMNEDYGRYPLLEGQDVPASIGIYRFHAAKNSGEPDHQSGKCECRKLNN
jgi:hypothetical protein